MEINTELNINDLELQLQNLSADETTLLGTLLRKIGSKPSINIPIETFIFSPGGTDEKIISRHLNENSYEFKKIKDELEAQQYEWVNKKYMYHEPILTEDTKWIFHDASEDASCDYSYSEPVLTGSEACEYEMNTDYVFAKKNMILSDNGEMLFSFSDSEKPGFLWRFNTREKIYHFLPETQIIDINFPKEKLDNIYFNDNKPDSYEYTKEELRAIFDMKKIINNIDFKDTDVIEYKWEEGGPQATFDMEKIVNNMVCEAYKPKDYKINGEELQVIFDITTVIDTINFDGYKTIEHKWEEEELQVTVQNDTDIITNNSKVIGFVPKLEFINAISQCHQIKKPKEKSLHK